MDNGALIFIIVIEAIVIVWMASKLKQYEKIEKLLDFAQTPDSTESTSSASAKGVTASRQSSEESSPAGLQAGTSSAQAATRAVSDSVSVGGDEELLDMPGVDPEGNIEEAKRVQLVMARCRYAEFYLEQLDDDYELGQFQRIINSCKNTARSIDDPFFRASALQPVIMLLNRAEWESERDSLIAEIDDDLIKEQINQALSAETAV